MSSSVDYKEVASSEETMEDLPLAVARATKVSAFNQVDLTEQQQHQQEEEQEPTARPGESILRVRVMAPCGLPPNHRLTVKAATNDGSTKVFDVRVPESGVYAGQEFEANQIVPKPVVGRFSDGLFDCGSEGNFCGLACCCPGIAFAAIMEKLKLTYCGGHQDEQETSNQESRGWTFAIVTACWVAFEVTYFFVKFALQMSQPPGASPNVTPLIARVALINMILAVYFVIVQTRTRSAFREKYEIPGNGCEDCCLAGFWCNCCTALQMFRHMKRSGDALTRFRQCGVDAEIV